MALIDNAMKASPQAKAPPTLGAAPQPNTQAGEQATPQEQDAYERVVMAGMKVLYDDSTHAGIMNMLRHGQDPAKALADTVAMIMVQIDQKSGGKIPEVVILPAAAELLGLTVELAQAAKIFQTDESTVARAMQLLIVDLADKYGVDPTDVQTLMRSVDPQQLKRIVAQQQQLSAPPKAATQPGA